MLDSVNLGRAAWEEKLLYYSVFGSFSFFASNLTFVSVKSLYCLLQRRNCAAIVNHSANSIQNTDSLALHLARMLAVPIYSSDSVDGKIRIAVGFNSVISNFAIQSSLNSFEEILLCEHSWTD